jgi:flagellar basal body-associated protein FliL
MEKLSSKPPKSKKSCLLIPLGVIGFLLLVVAASAISNLGLPQYSTTLNHLSDLDKARLSEVRHLRTALGDSTWPGWSEADIPLIIYNEQYAFLLG